MARRLDYNTGIMPWYGSRANLMSYYVQSWGKGAIAFDLFGGGGCALPFLSRRFENYHFSDLSHQNTRTVAFLKEQGADRGAEILSATTYSLASRMAEMSRRQLENFAKNLYKETQEPTSPLFSAEELAAAPLILGRIVREGALGRRWFVGIRSELTMTMPQAADRSIECLKNFLNEVDLDRLQVHRKDYREVLDIAEHAAKQGRVFVWADLPFPMEERGTKDTRTIDIKNSMPRAQYEFDMVRSEHEEFIARALNLESKGVYFHIPSYSNDFYDHLASWPECGKFLLVNRHPGLISWDKFYFPSDPKEPEVKPDKNQRHVRQKREFGLETAIEHAHTLSSNKPYLNLITAKLREIPTLDRAKAPKSLKPVTNLCRFWHTAKEALYYTGMDYTTTIW